MKRLSLGTSTAVPGPSETVFARPESGGDLDLLRKLHTGLHLVDKYLAQVLYCTHDTWWTTTWPRYCTVHMTPGGQLPGPGIVLYT